MAKQQQKKKLTKKAKEKLVKVRVRGPRSSILTRGARVKKFRIAYPDGTSQTFDGYVQKIRARVCTSRCRKSPNPSVRCRCICFGEKHGSERPHLPSLFDLLEPANH